MFGYIYFGVINLLTFCVFGVDKQRAMRHKWRISEATLFGLSIIGGSVGGLLGMVVFQHKTRKFMFRYGLPVIFAIQFIVALLLKDYIFK
ncbi:DUF1294 domain-containing protein [Enterococcus cecorum]|uniref:DUF1294 domain-containing protein n=1 Tax=Enterococcus cecorum TaxID=44008 RepID=A0A366SI91_9ENTE|nr:DUF1294 domain-containing protein [Enterococcus cecorum]RBR31145.1 hypothetical protein EB18_00618 [Enterococcus cecorum]